MNSSKDKLTELALSSRQYSYSPYSQKKIGAAVMLTNGQIYGGCNIENASYGGTVCAERVAIWKAFSENLTSEKIKEIVVSSDAASPWPPCGFCRQVIAEFGMPDTVVRLVNTQGLERIFKFSDLLPEAFTPTHLQK